MAQSLRCLEIDPLSSVDWGNLGSYYTELGDFPRARSAFNRALEISPDNDYAAYELGLLELSEGHAEEALRRFEREPDEVRRLRGIAIAQHSLGHRRESDRALNDLVARARDRDPYQVARVHAWRGERERAVEWLERAYAQHDAKLRYLKADPLLRGLRGDPRFTALLRKVGLPLD